MELTAELRERFMNIDPAQIGHYLQGNYMLPRIKPLSGKFKIIGPAYTVRTLERDNNALYYALLKAPRGSVIVVDRGGDEVFACAGEIVAATARQRGMEALVIDGPATDSAAILRMEFPVFCTGLSSVTTNPCGSNGVVDVPVCCGGAVVNPGDIVFGDADGVIVFPPEEALRLLELAEKATAEEAELKAYIRRTGFVDWDVEALYRAGSGAH
ncbi:MAG: 4-hydroxy-4-methyl-2-oxoglutarate aldolase [Firmicutes bacterium ADurb.Bin248]|jgi:regulator of RNase E activity RraA|nr:MAG: 4-hydroxy-4-methyl-2-oxoglutarate aldolase [Firmicutes bacterium ADurb.Bin248]HOF99697.1 RraA family protein [Clostridia bacterium]HPK15490.1 RraA family protein [Clostridia bacterium]